MHLAITLTNNERKKNINQCVCFAVVVAVMGH